MADIASSLNTHPSIKLQFLQDSDLYGNDYFKRIGMTSGEYWRLNGIITCDLACLNETFTYYYVPGVYYSIDEGLIRFTGRYCYKQFVPNKPAGEGIKTYSGCDAEPGYCHSFFFYRKRFLDDIRDDVPLACDKCCHKDCVVDDLLEYETCERMCCEEHC